jgi:predicted oxidoreductase
MKKLKQIIFLLTVLAMFLIAGNMDCGEISLEAAVVLSAVNFIIMAWSGFSSGLLAVYDKKEKFIILNSKMKNLPSEKHRKLIEMARVMFEEDFNE